MVHGARSARERPMLTSAGVRRNATQARRWLDDGPRTSRACLYSSEGGEGVRDGDLELGDA